MVPLEYIRGHQGLNMPNSPSYSMSPTNDVASNSSYSDESDKEERMTVSLDMLAAVALGNAKR